MGSRNSNLVRKNRIGAEWTIIGQRQRQKCTVVKHRFNGRVADCYHVMLDPRTDFFTELEVYNYRRLQNQGLVQVFGAELINTEAPSFCGMEKVVKVLTQPIPYRLATLSNLSLEECLYILLESLRGFYEIFERLGAVDITDELICVTPQGLVKVWVNSNLAQNHPNGSRTTLQVASNDYDINTVGRSQAQMVRNLFEVVEDYCGHGKYPSELRAALASTHNIGFHTAQILILDFSSKHGITTTDHIDMDTARRTQSMDTQSSQKRTSSSLQGPTSKLLEASMQTEQVRPVRSSQPQRLSNRFIFEGAK